MARTSGARAGLVQTPVVAALRKARRDAVGFNSANRDAWVADVARRMRPGTRVLDVGAGECPYRHLFQHCRYETQDFCQYEGNANGTFPETWSYGEIDFVCDITSIPVDDDAYDAVLCTEVLEHVYEPIRVLAELARILRPGGRLFVSAPLGSGLHQLPHHYYGGFTPSFYRRALPDVGLELQRIVPNGGFFRHLLQELDRAGLLLRSAADRPRLSLSRVVAPLIFSGVLPLWLRRVDDRLFIEDFTVGYHVEATKPPKR